MKYGETVYEAAGGNGGNGGDGGGLHEGEPVAGKTGKGCHYGIGGAGGLGAEAPYSDGRLTSNGGDGGKGFPGETLIVELADLSVGDHFEIRIGKGGGGGDGGKGYETGNAGVAGADGFVFFVPLFTVDGD
ncbi:MAG: hypothetical protein OXN26_16610 [Gammaproteobacteria bacterium]|nr:hypothetical protein [Gammaproteobacteria bacterium]